MPTGNYPQYSTFQLLNFSALKRIGLTGGIGCGKSTVVNELRRQDIPCFVADEVARNYYNLPSFVKEVETSLGEKVTLEDGSVDRAAIARIVFADNSKLDALNNLVHPRVVHDFEVWCQEHSHEPLVFFESAILYEYGFDRLMDAVVAVYLDRDERIRRLLERDHCSVQAVEARMQNQWPDEQKTMQADFVILNYEGNPRSRQVKTILERLL